MGELINTLQCEQSKTYDVANLFDLARSKKRLDIGPQATGQRYRFVECGPVLQNGTLRIHEYTEMPTEKYVAVSHVWRDSRAIPEDLANVFEVKGKSVNHEEAPAGDKISIALVQYACQAAVHQKINLLWLDRFCVVQADDADSMWQVSQMHMIYRRCEFCIIFPGGLAQLSPLNEEAPWIHRGWTLQEAVAPPKSYVVFSWTGSGSWAKSKAEAPSSEYITPVIKGCCAMASLLFILDCCFTGSLVLTDDQGKAISDQFNKPVTILGARPPDGAPNYQTARPCITMLAAVISQRLKSNEEQRNDDRIQHCLWKCMFMRVTFYRRDLVCSAMGLFNVKLNPNDYHENELLRPVIALAQGILKNGKGATWLGASFWAPPCPQLSSFPEFPRFTKGITRPAICIDGQYREVSSLMTNEYLDSTFTPTLKGTMDDTGYLTLRDCISVPVTMIGPETKLEVTEPRIRDTKDKIWQGIKDAHLGPQSESYAILLGCFFLYDPSFTPNYENDNIRGLIVTGHGHEDGKFHVLTNFMLPFASRTWISNWRKRDFCIGGPEGLDMRPPDEEVEGVVPFEPVAGPTADHSTIITSPGADQIAPLELNQECNTPRSLSLNLTHMSRSVGPRSHRTLFNGLTTQRSRNVNGLLPGTPAGPSHVRSPVVPIRKRSNFKNAVNGQNVEEEKWTAETLADLKQILASIPAV